MPTNIGKAGLKARTSKPPWDSASLTKAQRQQKRSARNIGHLCVCLSPPGPLVIWPPRHTSTGLLATFARGPNACPKIW
uniref:Uncharacterized protein n=1 Tax=Leersia perrieri TaxID=77586 RepID=A0A0D9WEB9_9ORYZ